MLRYSDAMSEARNTSRNITAILTRQFWGPTMHLKCSTCGAKGEFVRLSPTTTGQYTVRGTLEFETIQRSGGFRWLEARYSCSTCTEPTEVVLITTRKS